MKKLLMIANLALIGCATSSFAQMGHTDLDSFENEIPMDAVTTVLDFENIAPGSTVANGTIAEGFQFGFDFDGVMMQVSNQYTTSSPNNFLGTGDAGLFQDGDDFTITTEPSNAFGLHIVSSDVLMDDDLVLTFNGVTVGLAGMEIQQTLSDGSFVYFLGVTNNTATDPLAVVSTLGDGVYLYNVDDVVRSINPATMVLLGDVNLDGVVNLLDVDPFINVLSSATFQAEADCNQDGVVNLLDVEPFIGILSGG